MDPFRRHLLVEIASPSTGRVTALRVVLTVILATLAAVACGSSDASKTVKTPDSGADVGVGTGGARASGGSGGAPAAGGGGASAAAGKGNGGAGGGSGGSTGTSVRCGSATCAAKAIGSTLTLSACCPTGTVGRCGLDVSQVASLIGITAGCIETGQPGADDPRCRSIALSSIVDSGPSELAGSCQPGGTCGARVDLASSIGVDFGCVGVASLVEAGPPQVCGSGSGADAGDASDAPAAIGACPSTGQYTLSSSGSGCGDLDDSAPQQRLDVAGCSGRFEYDSGAGKGVGGNVVFGAAGLLPSTPLSVGSRTLTCIAQATATTIVLSCAAEAGICSVSMTHIP